MYLMHRARAWEWRSGGAVLVSLLVIGLALLSCENDDVDHDSGGQMDYGPTPDQPLCKRPPNIQSCTSPGLGACPTTALCLGCECSGPNSVYACNGFTHDCRWFCTGCYPADYTLCDKNASKAILGICGYCYADSGPPGKCNVAYPDMGPDAAKTPDKGKDAAKTPDKGKE